MRVFLYAILIIGCIQSVSADWTTQDHDMGFSRVADTYGPDTQNIAWQREAPENWAYHDFRIYGDYLALYHENQYGWHRLSTHHIKDGEYLHTGITVSDYGFSDFVMTASNIFVLDSTNKLYRIDYSGNSLDTIWSKQTQSKYIFTYYGQVCHARQQPGKMICLDEDGNELWTRDIPTQVVNQPIVVHNVNHEGYSGDIIYTTAMGENRLILVRPDDGVIIDEITLGGTYIDELREIDGRIGYVKQYANGNAVAEIREVNDIDDLIWTMNLGNIGYLHFFLFDDAHVIVMFKKDNEPFKRLQVFDNDMNMLFEKTIYTGIDDLQIAGNMLYILNTGANNANIRGIGLETGDTEYEYDLDWDELPGRFVVSHNSIFLLLEDYGLAGGLFRIGFVGCGNGVVDLGEECDNSAGDGWGRITECADFDEFQDGIIFCNDPLEDNECFFNTDECNPIENSVCGNGVIESGETCEFVGYDPGTGNYDREEWGPITGCFMFDSWAGGVLSCYPPGDDHECHFDTRQCAQGMNPVEMKCGDVFHLENGYRLDTVACDDSLYHNPVVVIDCPNEDDCMYANELDASDPEFECWMDGNVRENAGGQLIECIGRDASGDPLNTWCPVSFEWDGTECVYEGASCDVGRVYDESVLEHGYEAVCSQPPGYWFMNVTTIGECLLPLPAEVFHKNEVCCLDFAVADYFNPHLEYWPYGFFKHKNVKIY